MEAEVLEQRHLAGFERIYFRFNFGADGLFEVNDPLPNQFAQTAGDDLQPKTRIDFAPGAAQVRHEDDPRLSLDEMFDGGKGSPDAAVVSDFARLAERNIKVHADEDSLPFDIKLFYGSLGHGLRLR